MPDNTEISTNGQKWKNPFFSKAQIQKTDSRESIICGEVKGIKTEYKAHS